MMVGTPSTPISKIHRTPCSTPGGPRIREEKILVTVRVRPLNRREQALYDLIAWECVDEHCIVFNSPNNERVASSYTFDRVFGPCCANQMIYEDGARDVALSAVKGMNATIFAYGQTSSGKTYTMRGITENSINDIYDHIKNTPERDFSLKFSALEIYNETVVDLLNRDSGSLQLLDDPEKGTIVKKLVEEVVSDCQHLKHLISVCEAQRQVGETALNDKSSRSHQIFRLTIESSLRESSGCVKSFIASLNLVDLAGSERVSQTNANGARLKEGSHINRSLLTLTTVIRTLSGVKRNGHVPYRNSKLTRILQSSLGGNARTAIICTMSPALSHVEQTRNTLAFATSAKEVTNNAQVNMVVSEKKLVKHLQKEVARLEAKLQSPQPSSVSGLRSLIVEKEMKIEKMAREMEELKRQRDLAQSQLESERKVHKVPKGLNQRGPSSFDVVRCLSFGGDNEPSFGKNTPDTRAKTRACRQAMVRRSVTSTDPTMIVNEIRKLEQRQRQLGDEANRALEVLHKEVSSHRLGNQEAAKNIAKLLSEIQSQTLQMAASISEETAAGDQTNPIEEISRFKSQGTTIESLERKLENVQNSIDQLVSSFATNPEETSKTTPPRKKKILPFNLSNRANVTNIIRPPCSPLSSSSFCKARESERENRVPEIEDVPSGGGGDGSGLQSRAATPLKSEESGVCASSRDNTPVSRKSGSVNVKKMQRMFKSAAEENIRSIRAYVTELKERVAKLQYQKQLLVCQVLQLEESNEDGVVAMDSIDGSPEPWHVMFEEERKEIIMLWHLCHVSLIHRTQFYLLFKGDPTDQMYMEVELRRLTWLEQHLSELGNASPALLGDEPAGSVSASIKALKQERDYLGKRVSSRLTMDEREELYTRWEIPPGGKQRRQLLANKLWTDPYNMEHIKESAELVAKLVGFCESGEHATKEMFGLTFVCPSDKKSWMGWNLISNLLNL